MENQSIRKKSIRDIQRESIEIKIVDFIGMVSLVTHQRKNLDLMIKMRVHINNIWWNYWIFKIRR